MANSDREELKQELNDAARNMSSLQGDMGRHLDDSHFKDSFSKLRRQIRFWGEDFFTGPLSKVAVDECAGPELSDLAEDCREYIEDDFLRIKLVESYVWQVLNAFVFNSSQRNNKGAWWAGSYRKEYSGLRSYLKPEGW